MLEGVPMPEIKAFLFETIIALGFLLLGWLVAIIGSAAVAGLVGKTPLNQWLEDMLGKSSEAIVPIERKLKPILYYLVMIFVLVGFFQRLGLTMISEPLNEFLNTIFEFLPHLAAGAGLLLVAWLVASILKTLLKKAFEASKLDDKLLDKLGDSDQVPLGQAVSEAVYWLTFLLFLPAVLNAFRLEGMLNPVNKMVGEITTFLPNIISAAVWFAIGWFVAKIVQRLTSSLLQSFGVDGLGSKLGMDKALGKQKLSEVIGYLVYVFILIPVIIQALDALAIEAISKPAINMLDMIMATFPLIFGAVVILAIGYVLGKAIGSLVTNILTTVGFNRVLGAIGIANAPTDGEKCPASVAGKLSMIAVIYFALMEALHMLNFDTMTGLLEQFLVFAGQILVGLIVLGVGLFIANFVHNAIQGSATANANLLAPAARVAIIFLSAAMALRQMGLANEIINMAFGILLGAIGVAIALAFGLGGRDVAAKQLDNWKKQLKG